MSAEEDYPWHSADRVHGATRSWSYVSAEAQWSLMCAEIDRLRTDNETLRKALREAQGRLSVVREEVVLATRYIPFDRLPDYYAARDEAGLT